MQADLTLQRELLFVCNTVKDKAKSSTKITQTKVINATKPCNAIFFNQFNYNMLHTDLVVHQ